MKMFWNVEDKSQFVFRKYLFIYVATLIRTFSEDNLGCFLLLLYTI